MLPFKDACSRKMLYHARKQRMPNAASRHGASRTPAAIHSRYIIRDNYYRRHRAQLNPQSHCLEPLSYDITTDEPANSPRAQQGGIYAVQRVVEIDEGSIRQRQLYGKLSTIIRVFQRRTLDRFALCFTTQPRTPGTASITLQHPLDVYEQAAPDGFKSLCIRSTPSVPPLTVALDGVAESRLDM